MWDKAVIDMIIAGIGETLYMTLVSTLFGYVFGLPLGVALRVTDKDGIRPNAVVYKILDFVSNIVRSVPFLILLIVLIPFTRMIVGKSYGSTATIVPLVVAATPFIGRMVDGRRQFYDYFPRAAGGGADFDFGGCNHCNRYDFRIFRNGGNRRRRRSWRYCNPLRVSPLSGGYYDCDGDSSDCACSDFSDDWYVYFE